MNILGIDSSGLVASAAILSEDIIISEFTVNNKQTHSQTLLPMIKQVVDMSGITLQEIDAIAIAQGPGSFTGLRIGASTAKGLALVLQKPIIPVPTLEGLAYRMAGNPQLICPIMDARRNQVYTGIYRMEREGLIPIMGQDAMDIHDFIQKINRYSEPVIILGDGVPVYENILKKEVTVPIEFAAPHMNRQSASAVAALGYRYFCAGKAVDGTDFKPIYLRKSQAEREREERLGQAQ